MIHSKTNPVPRIVINAECQTMMVTIRDGESQTAEESHSANGDTAGGLNQESHVAESPVVEESHVAGSPADEESHRDEQSSTYAHREVEDFWESQPAERVTTTSMRSRGRSVLCMHWRMERVGDGQDFQLKCSDCMMVISQGENGCKHWPLNRDGTNQFGPRLKCLQCRRLLLRNTRGSATFVTIFD